MMSDWEIDPTELGEVLREQADRKVREGGELRPEPVADDEDEDDDLDTETMLFGNDPEAGIRRTSYKDLSISQQVTSAGGQFVIGLIAGHIGLALVILAAFNRRLPFIIPAVVCGIPALIYAWKAYKRWKKKQFYSVKLLDSLGEETDDLRKELEYKQRVKGVKAIEKLQGKPASKLPGKR